MPTQIGKKSKRGELKQIWNSFASMFSFRRQPKLYTTFTRRIQLIQQVRELKRQNVNDLRKRLNVEYK